MRATVTGMAGKVKRPSLREMLSPDTEMSMVYLLLATLLVGLCCIVTKLSVRMSSIKHVAAGDVQ
eukprot:SAG22_NODE_6812_length_808_cov_1.286319_1_plen_64_part_10